LEALFGQGSRLEPSDSAELWSEVSTVAPMLSTAGCCVWRICPTPSAAPGLVRAVRARIPDAEAFYDWGGGLVWLSLPSTADAGAAVVRAAVREAGGHATLVVAPEDVRAEIPVFEPEPAALTALSKRVKESFDPRAILNPGRVREGL
jgi:glycolate oxidase FAD binding subunit